jgi:hypothetical protein
LNWILKCVAKCHITSVTKIVDIVTKLICEETGGNMMFY